MLYQNYQQALAIIKTNTLDIQHVLKICEIDKVMLEEYIQDEQNFFVIMRKESKIAIYMPLLMLNFSKNSGVLNHNLMTYLPDFKCRPPQIIISYPLNIPMQQISLKCIKLIQHADSSLTINRFFSLRFWNLNDL
ncbi:hypothetical protein C0995_002542 [Termitomyces sp. Mi166|nr:hypothetical protein C0995_002542 [Termitomyces sp. Mi166\